ncbi:MAG TPA: polysaccharide biosynthesis tyrosine autokinase [Candidatus Dormibacteraeota bacterium]|nr:polysaccharide biosynthesis tyrosine autokinase [Candidatus Dormibacteraeota bacterium]
MEPNEQIDHIHSGLMNRPSVLQARDAAEEQSLLTWEQAVRVLRKHRLFLFGILSVLSLATVALAFLLRDVYRPVARLEIDPLEGGITTLHEIQNAKSEGDQDYLDTQVQILQSDGLAIRVIRALRLDQSPEFTKQGPGGGGASAASRTTAAGASTSSGSYLQEQLDLAQTTPAESEALQKFHSKLSVSPVRGSRLVEVSFTSHDPKLAQAVTNTLVTQFMDQNYRNRYVTTMEASDWLSSQLGDMRRKVAESNQAVADYQKRYGLVESDEKDVPLGQLMGEVSRHLSEAQADRIQSEAVVRLIDVGQTDSIASFRDDTVYQSLLTHYAEVHGQLAQAQAVYGDENVNVKKLKSEIEELGAQVQAVRDRLVQRARSTFEAAKGREEMMIQAREKLQKQMGDASSHLVEYGMLRNEAVANGTLYNTLQARLREAGIYAGLRSGNIRIVDMARTLQKPTGPLRWLIMSVGIALSLILAIGLVFVRESFDNTVRIPDDIRNWTRLPSLGVVPTVHAIAKSNGVLTSGIGASSQIPAQVDRQFSSPHLFWSRMQTAEGEAVRSLRTALLASAGGPAPQVILVSSPSVGEGKTTVALNLASVLAQHGKTCLIDGDMRRPMIESALNISPRSGLGEVLAGSRTLSEALIPASGVPGLMVLPSRDLPTNPSDLLATERMKDAVDSLRQQFEHVVIDSPPLLSFSDALALAPLCDAVILVSRYGHTTRRAMLRSAEMLADAKAPLLGVVLNDIDLASADYHYFNYGFSWAASGRKYEQVYKPFVPVGSAEKKEAEKSKGAHA